MKTTFLDFIKKQEQINESSIDIKNLDKYVEKVEDLLKKHIKGLVSLVGYVTTTSAKNEFISKQFIVVDKPSSVQLFQINWLKKSDNIEPYSIDFFKNMDLAFSGKAKSNLTINTLNSSLVYFLPIIWTVINTKDYNLTEKEAIDLGKQVFKTSDKVKESKLYVGSLEYHLFEDDNLDLYRMNKYQELRKAEADKDKSKSDKDKYEKLAKEYDLIIKSILGGAKSIGEIKLAINRNIPVTIKPSSSESELESKTKEESEDPHEVFKKMEGYIKMVIKGLNPSLILCGAPGVGKTYRVTTQLKEAGYKDGDNLFIIKGKCSPRHLYLALYKFKDKGNIILIDDADGLVGPKAPEECINILKGALDSTNAPEGRLVSYGIAGKITDDDGNELPKRFHYNGSVIIITNYNAGSLDTALRGRSYIQDIHFSIDSILSLIHDLIPKINPGKLSIQSKTKAYEYLKELVDEKMDIEVSIRTFGICSMLFESIGDDDLAKAMIKEQMKLQADRLKNKY